MKIFFGQEYTTTLHSLPVPHCQAEIMTRGRVIKKRRIIHGVTTGASSVFYTINTCKGKQGYPSSMILPNHHRKRSHFIRCPNNESSKEESSWCTGNDPALGLMNDHSLEHIHAYSFPKFREPSFISLMLKLLNLPLE